MQIIEEPRKKRPTSHPDESMAQNYARAIYLDQPSTESLYYGYRLLNFTSFLSKNYILRTCTKTLNKEQIA